jgi:hypothetical protein
MPRYYFNIRSRDAYESDVEGEVFDSVAGARREAVESARDLIAELARMGRGSDGMQIEISDKRGELLAVVPFSDALLN